MYQPPHIFEIEQFFKNFLQALDHPLNVEMKFNTDTWQRYECQNASRGNQNVAYKAYSNSRPCLQIQCHKCHEKVIKYIYNEKHKRIPLNEWKKLQQENAKEKTRQRELNNQIREQALIKIRHEWSKAKTCIIHPYLTRKQVIVSTQHGLRVSSKRALLCPIWSIKRELISLQIIYWNHKEQKFKKIFHKDTSPKTGFHIFGTIEAQDPIYLGEGIATCLTIKEVLNKPTVCVYGKHFNDIAPVFARAYPNKRFIYCCDLPSKDEKISSEANARQAIDLVGGKIVLPNFSMIPRDLKPDIPRSDFNDFLMLLLAKGLNRAAALEQVRQQIQN